MVQVPCVACPPVHIICHAVRRLPPQELEKCETDVLECDSLAACLYVNEPKTKVDLTKYIERHTFRWVLPPFLHGRGGWRGWQGAPEQLAARSTR